MAQGRPPPEEPDGAKVQSVVLGFTAGSDGRSGGSHQGRPGANGPEASGVSERVEGVRRMHAACWLLEHPVSGIAFRPFDDGGFGQIWPQCGFRLLLPIFRWQRGHVKWANKPAAPNAGIASRLTIGHHWPGVDDAGRSEKK